MDKLIAPFPYFGGKSAIADLVWEWLGNVERYIEPFFGSGAVLLARPDWHRWWEGYEIVNDADGLLANFWRAVASDPDAVAEHANWPINEADLHARHLWLVGKREAITERLIADQEWFDAKAAGWWIWGISQWIGGGWCSGEGSWHAKDGKLVKEDGSDIGINRSKPRLTARVGIFADACAETDDEWRAHLMGVMRALRNRLRNVQVVCGDWSRVVTPAVLNYCKMPVGVFLDPPYDHTMRATDIYAVDNRELPGRVREWCLQNGDSPNIRIALCGYEGEHNELERHGWRKIAWKAQGGYRNIGNARKENRLKERIWFSPHCAPMQPTLFGYKAGGEDEGCEGSD